VAAVAAIAVERQHRNKIAVVAVAVAVAAVAAAVVTVVAAVAVERQHRNKIAVDTVVAVVAAVAVVAVVAAPDLVSTTHGIPHAVPPPMHSFSSWPGISSGPLRNLSYYFHTGRWIEVRMKNLGASLVVVV
jgi:hypothetical protein